jgi:ribonuclease HI
MKKNKFYVVWVGNKTGVFESWVECQLAVKNYKGSKYKSFIDKNEAEKAFIDGYEIYYKKDYSHYKNSIHANNAICVDAASSGNPGIMEYQGVDILTKKILFKKGPYKNATNNIGEFLALVHGIAYLEKNKKSKIIYSDSKTAISWVKKKKCKTTLKKNSENKEVFELISRAIKWLNENNYNVNILKWDTKLWGEIPADFGRK